MDTENFSLAELLIQSEQSGNWRSILATAEQYFIFEITAKTENFLHLSTMIDGDDDFKLIQKLAKQIYGKIAPYGRVRVAVTKY